jgi:hypothetical protein
MAAPGPRNLIADPQGLRCGFVCIALCLLFYRLFFLVIHGLFAATPEPWLGGLALLFLPDIFAVALAIVVAMTLFPETDHRFLLKVVTALIVAWTLCRAGARFVEVDANTPMFVLADLTAGLMSFDVARVAVRVRGDKLG